MTGVWVVVSVMGGSEGICRVCSTREGAVAWALAHHPMRDVDDYLEVRHYVVDPPGPDEDGIVPWDPYGG